MTRRSLMSLYPALFASLVTLATLVTALAPALAQAANQAPTVRLTTPQANSVHLAPATVTLTATAADADGSIAKVVFFNGTAKIFTDTTAPYSYTWKGIPAGSYSLTAQATDNIGAVTTSTPVTLNVNVNPPPEISLPLPIDGSQFVQGAPIRLEATASDGDGIGQVEFFHDSTLLATTRQPPFIATWTPPAAGSYRLTAKASDTLGATATSPAVTISVTATPATTLYYIESDHLGTPRNITDESGKTVWRWANREPFGDSPPETDPDGDGKAFEFNLRYPGQYYDAETGLSYNFFRDYDARVGRYVESDPIGLEGGLNTFAYADSAPTLFSDPLGLMSIPRPVPVPPVSGRPGGGSGSTDGGGGAAVPGGRDRPDGRPDRPTDRPDRCEEPDRKCRFVRQVYYGGPTKTCWYQNKGVMFTFPQWKDKPCPPINPDTCMVDTTGLPGSS